MKKQLFTLALSALGLSAFCQSAVWQPYNSNVDTSYYVKYISVVDTNIVWGLGYAATGDNNSTNQFTRTIDGANFHAGTFLPDTSTFAPSNISAVDANTAFISLSVKAADGTSGQILKTTNGGATWTNIAATGTTSTTGMFIGSANFPDWVHFWDPNNGVALGDPNGSTTNSGTDMFEIWRTNNGGNSWTRVADANVPVPTSGEYGLNGAYTSYKKWLWSGTSDGRVYASADSGKTWTVSSTTLASTDGLAFKDSLNGLVWGSTSSASYIFTLLKTADGGNTWAQLKLDSTVGTSAISAIPNKGYMSVGLDSVSSQGLGVVGNGIITSVTYNDGASWTVLEKHAGSAAGTNTALPFYMLSVQMLDSSNGWAGNYSNNTLPYGTNGVNRFGLGHKLGCPITITSTSSSTPFNVCRDSSAILSVSGLNTYTWSTSATTASISVTPTVTTSYSVAATTTLGCSNWETFSITVVTPSVTAASHTICPGANIALQATGSSTYSWSPATALTATTGSTVTANPTAEITYTITGTKDLCTATNTVTVYMKPAPSLTITPSSYTVCLYGTAILTASGVANNYVWAQGTGGNLSATTGTVVTASPSSSVTPTSYTLSGTGSNGCVGKTVITLTVNATCTDAGIEQYFEGNKITVYPNPGSGLLTISMASIDAGTILYVTDMIGQEVMKTSVKDTNTNLDLSTLQKGVYMLTITNGQNKNIQKIIIE